MSTYPALLPTFPFLVRLLLQTIDGDGRNQQKQCLVLRRPSIGPVGETDCVSNSGELIVGTEISLHTGC